MKYNLLPLYKANFQLYSPEVATFLVFRGDTDDGNVSLPATIPSKSNMPVIYGFNLNGSIEKWMGL